MNKEIDAAIRQVRKVVETQDASIKFYKSRCDLLQQAQKKFRDPERESVCFILANGLPHPDGKTK